MNYPPISELKMDDHEEREINWRETVASGAGVRVTRQYVLTGTITKVMFHFPDGCNALVDMALLKDMHPFYPNRGFIALNDATPIYQNLTIGYYAREPLTLVVQNRDHINSHTVSCTVVIRFKKPDWWY